MRLHLGKPIPENHEPSKTGIPKRKKAGLHTRLSCKIDYFRSADQIAVSAASGFFTGDKQAIQACGAVLLYRPSYGPDFNPIENAFAKFKARVRKTAPRTFDALEAAAATVLRQLIPTECVNFFAHAGYGPDKGGSALVSRGRVDLDIAHIQRTGFGLLPAISGDHWVYRQQ